MDAHDLSLCVINHMAARMHICLCRGRYRFGCEWGSLCLHACMCITVKRGGLTNVNQAQNPHERVGVGGIVVVVVAVVAEVVVAEVGVGVIVVVMVVAEVVVVSGGGGSGGGGGGGGG